MSVAGRKIFVGSLPPAIDDATIRAEFNKYGQVEDIYIKPNCEPSRQWAFVTFASPEQAQFAKESCDRVLTLPGAAGPCDVMLAKNQGMFGQDPLGSGGPNATAAPKKIFVGSLPDGIQEDFLRAEFGKYGNIEDVFLKVGAEPGRQWAFISYTMPEEAAYAAQSTNNILQFAGSIKPCEVTLARNQGMFGQSPMGAGAPQQAQYPGAGFQQQGVVVPPPAGAVPAAPRKIFVGSLPDWITEEVLRSQFGAFGSITDVFVKQGCEPGRQWAFVTFTQPAEAQLAKESCDRILVFPGCEKPCEVTLARNQGLFGQEPMSGGGGHGAPQMMHAQAVNQRQPASFSHGPRKIFVGSLPDGITENDLRAEFSRFGHITDVYMKMGSHSGRHWSFITFNTPEEAQQAKVSTDRVLTFPGSLQPCEVIFAKNQGMFGQNPMNPQTPAPGAGFAAAPSAGYATGYESYGAAAGPQVVAPPQQHAQVVAPPPPSGTPPAHLTPWREYKTATGIPYYHNTETGETTWETPLDLQAAPAQPIHQFGADVRYSPY